MDRDHVHAETNIRAAIEHLVAARSRLGNNCAAYDPLTALIESAYDAERKLYECPHRSS